MRVFFFLVVVAYACGTQCAAAQGTSMPPKPIDTQGRIAMSTQADADTTVPPMRLACVPLDGQVFDPNGRPLVGATLFVKGTQQVYVTDSEGVFLFTEPIYDGQELTIGAAGYVTQDVKLTDCSLPRLVLEQEAGAHIKKSGKRAGQVIRLKNQSTTLK
jgi:hypothetical protein